MSLMHKICYEAKKKKRGKGGKKRKICTVARLFARFVCVRVCGPLYDFQLDRSLVRVKSFSSLICNFKVQLSTDHKLEVTIIAVHVISFDIALSLFHVSEIVAQTFVPSLLLNLTHSYLPN